MATELKLLAEEAFEPEDPNPYPDDNPKTVVGLSKVSITKVPPVSIIYEALALADGAKKYGPYNWRAHKITVSTYLDACLRHISNYQDGEDNAPDSGVHHLAHAKACLGLLLDAQEIGMLNDDRPLPGAAAALLERHQKTL